MAYPVTLNGRTYTLADFEGTNYVEGLPDAFEDFVTHAGDIYNSTSTTSNSIGTGSKTFTVESAKPYQAGTPLRIADAAAPSTNFMDCIVTSYSGTTLVVDAVGYQGSGTLTSWNVNIGGAASVAGTLGIAQGGTGGSTAADARTNLDVYSKADADSRFLNVSGEASDVTMTGNVTIGDAGTDTLTVNATPTFATSITSAGLNSSAAIVSTSNSNNLGNTTIAALTASSLTSSGSISISGNSNTLGATTFSGSVTIPAFILHDGDGDTFMGFPGADAFRLDIAGTERITADTSNFILNDDGGNVDFRVEGDTQSSLIFVDASEDAVGIGTSSPGTIGGRLSVRGDAIDTNVLALTHSGLGTPFYFNTGITGVSHNVLKIKQGNDEYIRIHDGAGTYLKYKGIHGIEVVSTGNVIVNNSGNDQDFRVESDNQANMFFLDGGLDRIGIQTSIPSTTFQVDGLDDGDIAWFRGNGTNAGGRSLRFGVGNTTRTEFPTYLPNIYSTASDGANSGLAIGMYGGTTNEGAVQFWTGASGQFAEKMRIQRAGNIVAQYGAVFNEGSYDSDFRVESDAQSHMLFVDTSESHIAIKHDNPNAELDVKGEQVLRGNTNNGGITQMADSGAYTTSTSSTDIFRIYGLSNNSAEITIIFADGSYRNGSMIQKIYVSCHGSGTAPAGPNVVVENKSRAHNGTFPSHFTWSVSTSGSYAIFSCTADQTISGAGTLHVHVNSIGYTGGKSLEMLI